MSVIGDNNQDNLTSQQVKLNEMVRNLNVLDKDGKAIDFDRIVYLAHSANEENNFSMLNSIDELRAHEPAAHGELAIVLSYSAGTGYGGGIFISDFNDKTAPEDGGMTIVTPRNMRWKRYITDNAGVTVVDFGAIPDGKTDCLESVTRMWHWSRIMDRQNNVRTHENVGIRFPAGNFFISKFDFSGQEVNRFRLSGAHVNFGYFPNTRLFSDQKDGEYMFTVNARWTYISGIIVNGQDNTKTKGFFKNIIPGGQYLRVTGVHFQDLGGRALDLLDTLDCKIDQWYATRCAGSVIYGRWSDRAAGSWDHLTAIELSNFNIQYGVKSEMIDLPRATQCVLHNGWIEHTEFPGDLSNGQWKVNALNLEGNKNPLKCHHTRLISTMLNVHNGEGLDLSDSGERWLPVYEEGQIFLENHGARIEGSLNYEYITSQERMDNRQDRETWFKVGEIEMPEWTTQMQMRIIGSSQFNAMPETQIDFTSRTPEGEAIISIQNVNGSFNASWAAEGSCPVTRVRVRSLGSSRGEIFVKLAKYTGFCIALITTNCHDRFSRGVHFRFIKSYTQVSAAEAAVLDAEPVTAFLQHWEGTDRVGYGYNNNNDLIMRGRVVSTASVGTARECLRVRVNGLDYAIELKPINS